MEYDQLPKKIKDIMDTFDENVDPYQECVRLLLLIEKEGYYFEYGLDGVPCEFVNLNQEKMKNNWVTVFNEGWELHWPWAYCDDDNRITSIECLNIDYGMESNGDWIYKIKYAKGSREADVFHNEITILEKLN